MSARYAVLHDLDTLSYPVIGLVIDGNPVRAMWQRDIGLKTEFADAKSELQPDGSTKTVSPGDPEYFDRVLYMLSRSFLVGELFPTEPPTGGDSQ